MTLAPDTAMPSIFAIDDFEKEAGMPVFTANGITMWHAMNLVGEQVPNARFGSLIGGKLG